MIEKNSNKGINKNNKRRDPISKKGGNRRGENPGGHCGPPEAPDAGRPAADISACQETGAEVKTGEA